MVPPGEQAGSGVALVAADEGVHRIEVAQVAHEDVGDPRDRRRDLSELVFASGHEGLGVASGTEDGCESGTDAR